MCICIHSALIELEKNHHLKNLLLLHSQIVITYSFNSSLKSVEINDLIMNKKKIKKEKNKEMNISLCVKFQDAHCLFKHKI